MTCGPGVYSLSCDHSGSPGRPRPPQHPPILLRVVLSTPLVGRSSERHTLLISSCDSFVSSSRYVGRLIVVFATFASTQERPSPLRQWCISPCFRFPPIFTFSQKNSIFIRQNILWPFLVFDYKFRISPLFSLFEYISPYFWKIIVSPLLLQILPDFVKFTCFYILYVFLVSPLVWPWCIYASHDARTGRSCI